MCAVILYWDESFADLPEHTVETVLHLLHDLQYSLFQLLPEIGILQEEAEHPLYLILVHIDLHRGQLLQPQLIILLLLPLLLPLLLLFPHERYLQHLRVQQILHRQLYLLGLLHLRMVHLVQLIILLAKATQLLC